MTTPCARETLTARLLGADTDAHGDRAAGCGQLCAGTCARPGREGGSLFVFKKLDLCAEEERTDGCAAPLAREGSVAI